MSQTQVSKFGFSNYMNEKYLLVGDGLIPDWVLEKINSFRNNINNIAKNSVTELPTEQSLNDLIKALEVNILPPNFKITKPLDKPEVTKLIRQFAEELNDLEFTWYNWLLMNAGFLLSTILPTSLDEDSLTIPDDIQLKRKQITEEFRKTGDKHKYNKEIEVLAKEALEYFTKTGNALGDFINSKANGTLAHIQELLIGIGFALNSKGEIVDVITNSLVEGVDQTDYFSNSSQGIVALFSKSNETAKPGYLGKKLSNVLEKVKLGGTDCGSTGRLEVQTKNKMYLSTFVGRNFSNTKNGSTRVFTEKDIDINLNKPLFFRDPMFCRSRGETITICEKCYDQNLLDRFSFKEGDNIGLLTSTGILGSLINLTLKKSHTGISLDLAEVDLTKDLS